jgi:diacylglycerol kinase (ATP)
MRTALLVYNPQAGRLPVRPFISTAAGTLKKAGWKVRVAQTRSGDHATHLARRAAAQGLTAVFAVGGDGTVGQVASGLVGSDTALGILPAGTSNVLAKDFGLPPFNWTNWNALQNNAELLADAPIHSIDVGICNKQPFLLWAGIGLDAMTVHTLEPRVRVEKFFAFPEYAATAIWNASNWHGIRLTLHADGKAVEGHFLLAVANNIRRYMGGIAVLSPQAYLDDGLFDLWLFSGDSLADALRHAFDLWSGRHLESEHIRRLPFQSLRVSAETPIYIQADGEPLPPAQEVEIHIKQRALKMLIPPRALSLLSNNQPSSQIVSEQA